MNIPNDQASSLYAEAVVKSKEHIDIVTAYAKFLYETGNYQASKEYWQKAAVINPSLKAVYEAEAKKADANIQD